MSKIQNIDQKGWRNLTDTELGFLMTTRNYAGALVLKFIQMEKDAAAIDLNTGDDAAALQEKLRTVISKAHLTRTLQVYHQSKTCIISKVRYGEGLKLTADQEAVFT